MSLPRHSLDIVAPLVHALNTAPIAEGHADGSFSTSLIGKGSHPESHLDLVSLRHLDPSSRLQLLYVLPPTVFVDKYQLEQRAKEGYGPSFRSWGETDLEKPEVVADKDGSVVLFDITDFISASHVEIPLHLRYPDPAETGHGYVDLKFPWPYVFWTSGPSNSAAPLSLNISSNSASILRIKAFSVNETHGQMYVICAPTGRLSDLAYVEFTTIIAIWGCFLWVCWEIFRARRRIAKQRALKKTD